MVSTSTVSGNFCVGLAAFSPAYVEARGVVAFDNRDDFSRIRILPW